MKKLIAFLLTFACLICLSGCNLSTLLGNDYEAADKTFEFQGLKITLTEAFVVDDESADSVWYESTRETSVSIDKFPLSATDKESGLTAEFLAEEMRTSLPYEKVSELKTDNDLLYLECEVVSLGFEFLYFISFYESEDALWMAYFMCDLEDYDTYKEYFIKWAQSVVLP